MFQKDALVLPLFILALLALMLYLIFGLRGELPDLVVKSERDDVFVAKTGDASLPLPAPGQMSMSEGALVRVQNVGWATLHFGDGLRAEIMRQGQLVSQAVEPESDLLKLSQELGTILNDFDANQTVIKRLAIEHQFNPTEFNLGEVRIVSTTAYGTKFMIDRESVAPLLWVVAVEAGENDLSTTVTDGGQTSPPFPVTSGSARWVAPIGEPSPPIPVPLGQIDQWVNGLRNGQFQPVELGDVIWQPANDKIDGQDFQSIARLSLQRRAPVSLPVQGGGQGAIELILDPGGQSGQPVMEIPLEDCNRDGLLDLPVRNNETLAISFRPTTARVRNLEVEIYNRAGPFSAALQMFDPAHRPMGPAIGSTIGQAMTETLKAAISPAQGVFHFAELKMFNGCLLALALIPPAAPSPPVPPVETPTTTPSPTMTPLPAAPVPPPPVIPLPPTAPPVEVSQCPLPSGWVEYITQTPDTWDSLGQRVGRSVYELQQANCRTDQLQPGQRIYLPFIPPTPTATLPIPTSLPTRTPTPTAIVMIPFITDCRPSSLTVSRQPSRINPWVDFSCTGGGLRPNEAGFRVELRGPNGQNVFQFAGGTNATISGTIPAALPAGQYHLVVSNPDNRAATKSPALTVGEVAQPPPLCFRATPNSGFNDRESQIVIEGQDFRPTESGFRVQLVTNGVGMADLPLVGPGSSASVTVIVPAGLPAGLYNIEVTNPDGLRCAVPYQMDLPPGPVITDFEPKSGDITLEVSLTVTGTNFRPAEAGFVAALRSSQAGQTTPLLLGQSLTGTSFQAIIGANTLAPGLYDLIVTNPDGQAAERGTYEAIAPLTVAFDRAAYFVDEPFESTPTSIEVVLSAAANQTVTVRLRVEDGTARNGEDYSFRLRQVDLVFPPGVTRIPVPIGITSDALDEFDETVNLTLSQPVNAMLGTPSTAVLTIQDNDPEAEVGFCPGFFPGATALNVAEVLESAGPGIVEVCAELSGKEIRVDYTSSDETATAGSDYTAVSGTLTFAPGQTRQSIQVSILDDALDEENETVLLTLTNVTNGRLSPLNPASLTINDDDTNNEPPTAQDDSFTIRCDAFSVDIFNCRPEEIDVTFNDIDPDRNLAPGTVRIIERPRGSFEIIPTTGRIKYTPNSPALDTFTYQVCDLMGACSNIATVEIEVILTFVEG